MHMSDMTTPMGPIESDMAGNKRTMFDFFKRSTCKSQSDSRDHDHRGGDADNDGRGTPLYTATSLLLVPPINPVCFSQPRFF